MLCIKMTHYVTITSDGLYHVQNAVMGHFGQHHVHTKKQFDDWVKKNRISKENIVELKGTTCDCGLKAGEVKPYEDLK